MITRIEFSTDGATWQTASVSSTATEDDPCRGHASLSDDIYDCLECADFGEELEIDGRLYRMTSE